MSYFKDVKVGDEVYIEHRLNVNPWSWGGKYHYFMLPYLVEKVTRTQFTANGKRFKKDTGMQIGGGSGAYRGGSKFYSYGKETIVRDQTQEFKEAKERVKKMQYVSNQVEILSKVQFENKELIEELYTTFRNIFDKKELKDEKNS